MHENFNCVTIAVMYIEMYRLFRSKLEPINPFDFFLYALSKRVWCSYQSINRYATNINDLKTNCHKPVVLLYSYMYLYNLFFIIKNIVIYKTYIFFLIHQQFFKIKKFHKIASDFSIVIFRYYYNLIYVIFPFKFSSANRFWIQNIFINYDGDIDWLYCTFACYKWTKERSQRLETLRMAWLINSSELSLLFEL